MIIRDIVFSTTPPALHNVLWIKAGDNNINTLYMYEGGWRKIGTSSGGGTSDYNDLENKPRINNVVLEGNLTLQELGIILPDLSKYVTEEALSKTLEAYAKKSDIPDISNLATKNELSSAISEQKFKTINGQEITGEGDIKISGGSITVDDELSETSTNPVQNKVISEELKSMSELLSKLDEKVFPTTLTVSGGGTYDEGTTQVITVTWKLQKDGQTLTPDSVTVNGEVVDSSANYKVFTDVTTTTTYTVSVVYGGKAYTGKTTVTFKKTYYRYYGGIPGNTPFGNVTLEMVKALKKEVCTGAGITLTYTDINDQRMVNAYPKTFGQLTQIKDGALNAPLDNWDIEAEMNIDGTDYYVYASKEVNYEYTGQIIFVK